MNASPSPESPSPESPSDTAGVPWVGRDLPSQPFAGDDGRVNPVLAEALAGYASGAAEMIDVVQALSAARVLVPVVAVLGEDHPLSTHARGDLAAEMAIVTITGADGRRALPVFSSIQTLAGWDADARPVPVESARAALSAVAEDCELLVLDAAGPVTVLLPRPAVWALGQSRAWTPPGADPELAAAVDLAVRPLPDVLATRCEPIGDAGVRIVLGVRAGLPQDQLTMTVHAAQALIAEVEMLPERADAVELKVLPA
jgi:hypothetical protein